MALDDEKKFIKIGLRDIELGRALRWAIFNGDRQQVYPRGAVIQTVAEAEEVIARGAYCLMAEATDDPRAAILVPERKTAQEEGKPAGGAQRPAVVGLDTARIRIGDPIQLQTNPESPRYIVRLVGYLKNRGVIVTQPELNGEMVMLREGMAFVGRFFSGQSAYAFTTNILKQTSVPYPHLHLAYPREITVVEVRRSPRVDVSLIAAIELPDGGAQFSGKVVNLSVHGVGLRTKTRIVDKGATLVIKLKVMIEGIETFMVLSGEVCSIQQDDDPALPFNYGLKLVTPDNNTQLALAAFVYGRLLHA